MTEGARSVLVVDADEETRSTLGILGHAEGCHVIAAASWQDALGALRDYGSHLQLIIVSLDLPDLSWISVIGRVQEMNSDLPVIVTTTTHSDAAELFVRRLGAVLYAPKPLDPGLLRKAIRGALRTTRPLPRRLHESNAEERAMQDTKEAHRR